MPLCVSDPVALVFLTVLHARRMLLMLPQSQPQGAAGGEPGDEAQLLQSSCSTYENRGKEEQSSAITQSGGVLAHTGAQPEHPDRSSCGL